jgi:hypothetical protein
LIDGSVRIAGFSGHCQLLSSNDDIDDWKTMDFHARRQYALRLLAQTGIDSSSYAPPLMQLLWRCGLKVRPPHFMGYGAAALLSGTWFGAGWGAVMWVAYWSSQGTDARMALIGAIGAGLCFGLFMASYYARQRKKHDLPSWESLGAH